MGAQQVKERSAGGAGGVGAGVGTGTGSASSLGAGSSIRSSRNKPRVPKDSRILGSNIFTEHSVSISLFFGPLIILLLFVRGHVCARLVRINQPSQQFVQQPKKCIAQFIGNQCLETTTTVFIHTPRRELVMIVAYSIHLQQPLQHPAVHTTTPSTPSTATNVDTDHGTAEKPTRAQIRCRSLAGLCAVPDDVSDEARLSIADDAPAECVCGWGRTLECTFCVRECNGIKEGCWEAILAYRGKISLIVQESGPRTGRLNK